MCHYARLEMIDLDAVTRLHDVRVARLTQEELVRLTRWKWAYEAESAFGADDGKRWAFARYLRRSGRLSESAQAVAE